MLWMGRKLRMQTLTIIAQSVTCAFTYKGYSITASTTNQPVKSVIVYIPFPKTDAERDVYHACDSIEQAIDWVIAQKDKKIE
jgi:hypothetical protein